MAISIIEGTLGAGKTVCAARLAIERVAKGGSVFTNIDFIESRVRAYVLKKYGVYTRAGQITRLPPADEVTSWVDVIPFGTLEAPILVVLDEAQMFYNSRDWKKTQDEHGPMLSFLTQSRKAGVDIIFVSQDSKNVDSQFRRLAEVIIKARNLAHIAFPVFGFKLKGVFHYTYTEVAENNVFERRWWIAEKDVFECYRTEAFLDSLMQEMAETKERLDRFKLRPVPWERRLVSSLEGGDFVERWLARQLRPWAASAIKRKRKHETDNSGDNHRSGVLGRVESSNRPPEQISTDHGNRNPFTGYGAFGRTGTGDLSPPASDRGTEGNCETKAA